MDGTGELFQPFVEAIGSRARCTICAYPTHTSLDYDQLSKLVERRIPRSEPWVIVAESFSGPVAVKIAAANPRGLKGVILCASFVKNPFPLVAPVMNIAAGLGILRISPPEWVLRWLLLGPHASERLIAMSKQAIQKVSPEVLAYRVRMALSVDVSRPFQAIRVPVAYIAGKMDQLFSASALSELQCLKPAIKVVSIDAPHFILQTQPQSAAALVLVLVTQFESA
jgi:pimeloyl-ACP methyl ester carboxylesterase